MVKDMPVSRPKVLDSKTKKKLNKKDKKSANLEYHLLDKMKIAPIIGVAAWRRGGVAAWRRGTGEVRPDEKIDDGNVRLL